MPERTAACPQACARSRDAAPAGRSRAALGLPCCRRSAACRRRPCGRRTGESAQRPEDRLAGQPGHLADQRRQPADRRRADAREGRHAAALQLRRLHRARGGQGVREEVRRRRQGLDLQRHRRGADQDPLRRRAVRPLLPELRPDRQAGHGRAAPAAQPQLHPATSPTCGRASTTPGTTGGWHYTVPYTVYTTGIGWRTDKVTDDIAALANPYDVFWDTAYARQDRGHRRLAHRDGDGRCCATASPTSTPTTPTDLAMIQHAAARHAADDAARRSRSRCTTTCPPASSASCQMWSGDVVNAQYYLPKGVSPTCCATGSREDGKGVVDNDLMVVLGRGKNPVLAHLFLNHMLDDEERARRTSATSATSRRRTRSTPRQLVADGYVPENLATAVVRAGVVRRRATACSSCRPPPTPRGTRSGSSSRPAR